MCVYACLSVSLKQVNKNTKAKNNNKKRMPNWNKMKPKAHRKSWNWFCVGLLCSMYYVHGSCPGTAVDITNNVPLKKGDFPFASGYQL